MSLSEGAPLDACQAAFATSRLDEMRGAVGSPTGLQPWLVSSLPSLGSRVDPRQRGVLPVHTHLHGFEPAAHAGAAEGARGVPDHGQGASGGSRRPARRRAPASWGRSPKCPFQNDRMKLETRGAPSGPSHVETAGLLTAFRAHASAFWAPLSPPLPLVSSDTSHLLLLLFLSSSFVLFVILLLSFCPVRYCLSTRHFSDALRGAASLAWV